MPATSSATRDRVRHLLGVLDDHCEAVGRDSGEITRTRLGTPAIGRTHEEAARALASWPDRANLPEERLRMVLILGDPDEVGEQVQALLDAGLDALIVQLPNPGDLELLALAGETMSAAVAARA